MILFSSAFYIVTNLVLIGGALGQLENAPSADEVLRQAGEAVNVPGLNVSALPVEEARSAFKKKCQQNGGEKAFINAENAPKEIESCVKELVNMTVLHEEMELAKPVGELDTLFKNYCAKSPKLKICVNNFTDSIESCFTAKERENLNIVQNITDSLLDFVCFNDGDRIALFIAAGGPECISSKQTAIQNCVNTTFGSYVPAEEIKPDMENPFIQNFPALLLNTKECSDIEKLQLCIVKELETCTDPTTGNIVDSLLNFIKRTTPCENLLSKIRTDTLITGETIGTSSSTIINIPILFIAINIFTIFAIA